MIWNLQQQLRLILDLRLAKPTLMQSHWMYRIHKLTWCPRPIKILQNSQVQCFQIQPWEAEGNKESILNSYFLTFEANIVMSQIQLIVKWPLLILRVMLSGYLFCQLCMVESHHCWHAQSLKGAAYSQEMQWNQIRISALLLRPRQLGLFINLNFKSKVQIINILWLKARALGRQEKTILLTERPSCENLYPGSHLVTTIVPLFYCRSH